MYLVIFMKSKIQLEKNIVRGLLFNNENVYM